MHIRLFVGNRVGGGPLRFKRQIKNNELDPPAFRFPNPSFAIPMHNTYCQKIIFEVNIYFACFDK